MLTGVALNSYPRMVLDYYVRILRESAAERRRRLDAIKTAAQAKRYRDQVAREIKACFGPLPKSTPLNARVTGVVPREGYRIEKVVFESRPGFLVSANCYIPENLSAPAPAALFSCGHSENGKANSGYQAACQALVLNGFVALVYDPVSQGERRERPPGKGGEELGCVDAHVMLGKKLDLMDDFVGTWRAWDGIRAHDYLRSRPEVDKNRIGVTGNSGGGTLSSFLFALDPRFAAAAPGCFITTFLRNLTNELPSDLEQCPPGIIGRGLDEADLLISGLPRPVLALGQRFDYFDARGLQQAAEDVGKIGRLLGMPPEKYGCFIGPEKHGFSAHLRQAMVKFFGDCFGVPVRPELRDKPVDESQLAATPRARVVQAGSRFSWALAEEQAGKLGRGRRKVARGQLPKVLGKVLRLPARRGVPDYTRPTHWGTPLADVRVARFGVETEPGIHAVLVHVTKQVPTRLEPGKRVSLWLPHTSSALDLEKDALARSLHKSGQAFYLDVRGMGESMPIVNERGFFEPEGWDSMFYSHADMLDQIYCGLRVFDVLRTLDLLVDAGAERVDLYGRGLGSLLALFAGCLHPAVDGVTLKNSLSSYEDMVRAPDTPWPPSSVVRGMLKELDLPDLRRYLGRRLTEQTLWGANPRIFS